MRLRSALPLAMLCGLLATPLTGSAESIVQEPFEGSALTDTQREAWGYYIAEESGYFGCSYGDDERLHEDPRALLSALAAGEEMEPVQVTLRTYLAAGESVRELLQRNMYIASMECNPVYVFEDDFIGHPVIPFEEFINILATKLRANSDLRAHVQYLRTVKPAAMDVRWFWAFFVLDGGAHQLMSYDARVIRGIAEMIPGTGDINDSNAYWEIYDNVFSQGLYVSDTADCSGEQAEPGSGVVVDDDIDWSTLSGLYEREGIRYRGGWRDPRDSEQEDQIFANAQPIENPGNPFFSVNRNVTIYPKECD